MITVLNHQVVSYKWIDIYVFTNVDGRITTVVKGKLFKQRERL